MTRSTFTVTAGCLAVVAQCVLFSGSVVASDSCSLVPRIVADPAKDYGYFGYSVDARGDWLAVGTPFYDGGFYNSGAVALYGHSESGWEFEEDILPPDPSEYANFGGTLAMTDELLIVAAPNESIVAEDAGAVYVYRLIGKSWSFEEKLVLEDAAELDQFGYSLSAEGDVIVIGVPYKDEGDDNSVGAAYVYRHGSNGWIEETKLLEPEGGAVHFFGESVLVDGDELFVSATLGTGAVPESGVVYAFKFDGATWALQTSIYAMNGRAGDWFGDSMSKFGNELLVGATQAIDENGLEFGTAYLFSFDGEQWNQSAELAGQNIIPTSSGNGNYGTSVSVEGDLAAIGDTNDGEAESYAGAVHVFQRIDGVWTHTEKLLPGPSDDNQYANLGASVAIDEKVVLASGDGVEVSCTQDGAVYLYDTADCDENGLVDACEFSNNPEGDCNLNDIPDACDIDNGTSDDLQANGIPDECESDCNGNLIPDDWDVSTGTSDDCQGNLIPDECESDCNHNGRPDECDIADGRSLDTDADGLPDECQPGACRADVNGDGQIDPLDTGAILSRLGCVPDPSDMECWSADVNKDGIVDPLDSGYVASRFGACPTQGPLFGHALLPVTKLPRYLLNADLNADGALDLIVSSQSTEALYVLMNDGHGRMGEPVSYGTVGIAGFTAAADVDGDADLDLIVAQPADDSIVVMLNEGDGKLVQGSISATGNYPSSIVVEDFDGDADPDLVIGSDQFFGVVTLANDGQGSFMIIDTLPEPGRPGHVVSGDFNQDSLPDFAAALDNGQVAIHFNLGDFTFDEGTIYEVGAEAVYAATTDAEADGDLDLAVITGSSESAIVILKNDGTGLYLETLTTATDISPDGATMADQNGDGLGDFFLIDAVCQCLEVYENQSDGKFYRTSTSELVNAPWSISVGDLDGNLLLDAVTGNDQDGDLQVVYQDPFAGWSAAPTYEVGDGAMAIETAQLNDDTWPDVLITNTWDGTVTVKIGTPSGYLSQHGVYEVGEWPFDVTSADLDNDGDLDAVVAADPWDENDSALGLYLLLNEANATFAVYTLDVGPGVNAVAVADLDRDGSADIIAALADGRLAVVPGLGDGAFGEPAYYAGWDWAMAVTVADFDFDGDQDILIPLEPDGCEAGYLGLFRNNGEGILSQIELIVAPNPGDFLLVGDLNGDQSPDALLLPGYEGDGTEQTLYPMLNTGDGTFVAGAPLVTGGYAFRGALADLDNDGDLDIALVQYTPEWEKSWTEIFLNQGDARFDTGLRLATQAGPSNIHLADLNEDQDIDVLVTHWDYDYDDYDIITKLSNRTFNPEPNDDCNGNGIPDDEDPDCDGDGIPDGCEFGVSGSIFGESIVANTTGLPDDYFLGPPDSLHDGIGQGGVIYSFEDNPIVDGSGPDLNVYGYDTYDYDFEEIDVLVSQDGNIFLSIKSSESAVVRIPGDEGLAKDEDARSYDLAASGLNFANFLSVQTIDVGARWAGFELNAVGVIYAGQVQDCNKNGTPDECDIVSETSEDCSGNGIPDECEADCNENAIADVCDILEGSSVDCDGDEVPDECVAPEDDCNANLVPDTCDVASGTSNDCNADEVPDECQPDCNGNATPDDCDLANGTSEDCNQNASPDECDLSAGTSADVIPPQGDGIPDECQSDCNANSIPDEIDLKDGTSADCNINGVPDECDTSAGTSDDCNGDAIPDECQLVDNDCNANHVPDDCDPDCNVNGVPDTCDIATGTSEDCNANAIPDECEVDDCNDNGIPDSCDLQSGISTDCNHNSLPDECEFADCEPSELNCRDCNENGLLDECDIDSGDSEDINTNGIPDDCEEACLTDAECDDGVACTIDDCTFALTCIHIDVLCECSSDVDCDDGDPCNGDEVCGAAYECQTIFDDCNANGIEDTCDIADGTSDDSNGDGVPDEC